MAMFQVTSHSHAPVCSLAPFSSSFLTPEHHLELNFTNIPAEEGLAMFACRFSFMSDMQEL